MFSCELRFFIDLLKKWVAEKYFSRHKELDLLWKQRFKRENPIDWNETNCAICGFCLPTAASNFPSEKITTFLDFVIEKEHSFIRNIFDHDELKWSKNIKTLEKYDASFKKMLRIVALLNTNYSKKMLCGRYFWWLHNWIFNEYGFESFEDLFLEIENTQVKNAKWEDRKDF